MRPGVCNVFDLWQHYSKFIFDCYDGVFGPSAAHYIKSVSIWIDVGWFSSTGENYIAMHTNYQCNGGAERMVASSGFLGQKQGVQPMGGGLEQEPG